MCKQNINNKKPDPDRGGLFAVYSQRHETTNNPLIITIS